MICMLGINLEIHMKLIQCASKIAEIMDREFKDIKAYDKVAILRTAAAAYEQGIQAETMKALMIKSLSGYYGRD